MQSVSPTLSRADLLTHSAGWSAADVRLKNYPHFDPIISKAEAVLLATDPAYVAQHRFYPFLRYEKRWNRFAEKGGSGKEKKRLIRYAARLDSYIFSNYRHILSEHYEAELARLGLEANVLAYRRIALGDGLGGKCNIHFAHEAFAKVRQLGSVSS
jgi:hypothetical protein